MLLDTDRLRLRYFGFTTLGVERISARTLEANVASQRVMQKCGLRRSGSFFYAPDAVPGRTPEERAAVKYELTRSEWLSPRD
jgi:RimJ/RimL family protein N-acetyltransferase